MPLMIGGAVLGGLGSLGSLATAFGGGDDLDFLEEEMARARQLEKQRFSEFQAGMSPYLGAGQQATNQMMAQLGLGPGDAFDVSQLPGYQQALQAGLGAVNVGGAGAGMLMSGERLKGLQRAGQDVQGQYYQDYMNRLGNLGQQGFQGATTLGQSGLQSAGQLSGQLLGGASNLMQGAQQARQMKMGAFQDIAGLGSFGAGGGFGGI